MKENKKNVLFRIFIVILVLFVLGISFFYGKDYIEKRKVQSLKETYDSLILEFNDNKDIIEIEYDNDLYDPMNIVKEVNNTINVKPEKIDTRVLKKVEVIYTLSKTDIFNQEIKREYKKTFVIKDNKKPIIEILNKEIEIDEDDEININDNLKVYDEVDGELKYFNKLINNSYTIESGLENKAGTYEIKIIAKDLNGLTNEESFLITVKEKIKEKQQTQNIIKETDKTQEENNINENKEETKKQETIKEEIQEEKEIEKEDEAIETNKEDETIKEEDEVIEMVAEEAITWTGPKLTKSGGVCNGPSGKETYYNLNMNGVIAGMRKLGYDEENYPYWIREDGCKMLGGYIMVAADFSIRPKGTHVETSLGWGIVCDTGSFVSENQMQLDLAVDW